MKIIRWVCALVLLLLLSAACIAFAEGASVTFVLGDNTPTNGNKHYVKDGRTYSRDLTVPLVNGQEVEIVVPSDLSDILPDGRKVSWNHSRGRCY